MSHYTTLGISKTATADEIKKAFRKLASQHHPDKGGDTAKFQEIQSAYDTLSDPIKRAEYDNPNHFSGRNVFGQSGDVNDLFRHFNFNFGTMGGHNQRQTRRNKDIRITLDVNLASTLDAQEKTVSIKTTRDIRETISVKIPKGITSGSTIKYSGLGDNFFESLPRGDLYVNINLTVPDGVELYENEIYQQLRLSALDAMIGTNILVTSPFGETFELIVPAGVQQGNKLRIKDKGLMTSNGRGHLFMVVDLVIPKNLSADQIKLLNEVKNTL